MHIVYRCESDLTDRPNKTADVCGNSTIIKTETERVRGWSGQSGRAGGSVFWDQMFKQHLDSCTGICPAQGLKLGF